MSSTIGVWFSSHVEKKIAFINTHMDRLFAALGRWLGRGREALVESAFRQQPPPQRGPPQRPATAAEPLETKTNPVRNAFPIIVAETHESGTHYEVVGSYLDWSRAYAGTYGVN